MNAELVPFRAESVAVTSHQSAANGGWIEMVAPTAELAKMIAQTEFVPDALRNKPAAITACILYGHEIGIGPMQSLAKVDIVKGRPAPRAELARGLALAAGHDLWTDVLTDTRVTVKGKRSNSTHEMAVTWTMDDARRAGLTNNPTYKKYPRQMLLARASAELVRQMCPEVLGGIEVFAEEAETMDAEPDLSGTPDQPKRTRKRAAKKPAPAPDESEDQPPDEKPADEPPGELITEAQTKKMMACFNEQGITDRGDRLNFVVDVIGRQVTTSKELTKGEASQVIEALVASEELPPLPDELDDESQPQLDGTT